MSHLLFLFLARRASLLITLGTRRVNHYRGHRCQSNVLGCELCEGFLFSPFLGGSIVSYLLLLLPNLVSIVIWIAFLSLFFHSRARRYKRKTCFPTCLRSSSLPPSLLHFESLANNWSGSNLFSTSRTLTTMSPECLLLSSPFLLALLFHLSCSKVEKIRGR